MCIRDRYIPRDTAFVSDTLDVRVIAALDKPYDAELDFNVTMKSLSLIHICMEPADRERIFQEFTRLPGAQGKEGFGLGLSIVRMLVQLLEDTFPVGRFHTFTGISNGNYQSTVLVTGSHGNTALVLSLIHI